MTKPTELRSRVARSVLVLVLVLAASLAAPLTAVFAADVDLSQPTPQAVNHPPQAMPEGEPLRNIQLSRWRSVIPAGSVIGKVEQGLFCGDSKPRSFDKALDDILKARISRTFEETATELRFIRKRGEDSLFEADASAGVDFRLGGTLQALDYRICERDGARGAAFARVKWELFSLRLQRVVYSAAVDGSYRSDDFLPAGQFSLRFAKAIVGNLLADPAFLAALRGGGGLSPQAMATLSAAIGPTVQGAVTKSGEALLQAVATVESGTGSGTAFYVSREGFLLTNHHVVADAKFVKVKLAGGRSLVGEVVRVDSVRDVALLRTDPPGVPVLAVRTDEPRVGEEVYVLGSPFGAQLSGSVSRGVLSSRRVLEGMSFLQSDAAVNPGNSGGPLVDANGQVLGLVQIRASTGVGLFIPVSDAMEKLGLKLPADAAGK